MSKSLSNNQSQRACGVCNRMRESPWLIISDWRLIEKERLFWLVFFWERSTSEKKKPPASSHFGSDPLTGVAEGSVCVDARHHRAVLFAHLSICIVYFFKVSAQMLLFAYLYLVFLQGICSDALVFIFVFVSPALCCHTTSWYPPWTVPACSPRWCKFYNNHKLRFGVMLCT